MPDTIIIFGAAVQADGRPSPALQARVAAALALGQRLPTPLYMPTGGIGRHGPAEAEVMRALLQAAGVPDRQIVPEPTARNTLRSVRACTRLLIARRHRGRVWAATSAYHLPRCVVLLTLAGWRTRPCPPPRIRAAQRFRTRTYWRVREFVAVPVDAAWIVWLRLTGRF